MWRSTTGVNTRTLFCLCRNRIIDTKYYLNKTNMKRFIYGALAFAAIVACNKDVEVKLQTQAAITFDDSFVEIKTRAAADPSITTASINAFDVWGYVDNATVVLDAERVTKSTDGWSYEDLQYWTPNKKYYFYAIAPVDDANIVVNTATADEYGLGTVTFTNVDGKTDLIYANKMVTTGDDVINKDPGKVNLQFAHQLAKVKFTFTNAFPTENTKVVVKNIKMVAPAKGTVTLAEREWAVEANSTVTLDFGHVNKGAKLENTEAGECDYELLTIPSDANRAYKITFTVELYYGDSDEPAHTDNKEITLTGQALKIGKNYNFTAAISAENLELRPIEFDVIEVEGWVEDNAKVLE